MRFLYFTAAFAAAVSLAACGGGSGTRTLPNTSGPQAAARHLVVAVSGTTSLSTARHAMAVAGTAVTVSFNGQTVGSGQLDSSGHVSIDVDRAIPPGATLVVTAGTVSATIVWNQTDDDAAVLVQVNADGTLTVTVASGDQPEASPDPNDPNGSTENEDSKGNPTSIDDSDGNAALPSNLPITVASTCSTVTVTPVDSHIASMRFEENVHDGDGGSKLKYEGPFTQAMQFALIAQSARLEIRLFDAGGQQLLDVKAPINAFTSQPGAATPAPCPSVSPTASASPAASPSPGP